MRPYNYVMLVLGTLVALVFIGCVAGTIFFWPPPHLPGSAQAVRDLHKWVWASVISGFVASLFFEEAVNG